MEVLKGESVEQSLKGWETIKVYSWRNWRGDLHLYIPKVVTVEKQIGAPFWRIVFQKGNFSKGGYEETEVLVSKRDELTKKLVEVKFVRMGMYNVRASIDVNQFKHEAAGRPDLKSVLLKQAGAPVATPDEYFDIEC